MSWGRRIRREAVDTTVRWTAEKLLTAMGSVLVAASGPFVLGYVPWIGNYLGKRVSPCLSRCGYL